MDELIGCAVLKTTAGEILLSRHHPLKVGTLDEDISALAADIRASLRRIKAAPSSSYVLETFRGQAVLLIHFNLTDAGLDLTTVVAASKKGIEYKINREFLAQQFIPVKKGEPTTVFEAVRGEDGRVSVQMGKLPDYKHPIGRGRHAAKAHFEGRYLLQHHRS